MADAKELDNIDEKSKLNSESDNAKIKFQHAKNGEAKVEMPTDSGGAGYQCGLTKEELMRYANDPFWVGLRRVLLVLFWLLWIAMLVGAIAIIIITPKCAAPKEPEWHESSPIYELRVDEFADGDSDQKSDLKGVNSNLPYIDGISISALVIDGLFNADSAKIIQPTFGSFNDFKELTAKKKVLIKIPVSKLDLSSEQKQGEFDDVLRFWMSKGAAGFVFDELELVTIDLPKMTEHWNSLIRNFSSEDPEVEHFPRISVLSSYKDLPDEEYCNNTNMILNYKLTHLTTSFTPLEFINAFESTTATKEEGSCRTNFVLSNGDIQPLINRVSPAERDRLIMFSLLSDATTMVYFGDEYGKKDVNLPQTLTRKSGNRPEPMDWQEIEKLKNDKNNSHYQVFVKTSHLRQNEYAIRMGDSVLKSLANNTDIVAMTRIKKGNPSFVIVTNFGSSTQKVDLSEMGPNLPESGHIEIVSTSSKRVKEKVQLKEFQIDGQDTLVVQFVPKFDKS